MPFALLLLPASTAWLPLMLPASTAWLPLMLPAGTALLPPTTPPEFIWGGGVFSDKTPPPSWEGAEWIGGASQLRADFSLPAGRTITQAYAYATGVGSFELHLNGAKVGNHVMDPGQTATDQRVLYVVFDVSTLLKPGVVNAVGALLGNGKFGYLDVFANRTAAGDQSGDATRALLLEVTATLDDGTTHRLTSNATHWKVRHGPIVYDHMWHGEIYDARLELPSWDVAPLDSFPPRESGWMPARRMAPRVGILTEQRMPPIRVVATLDPVTTHTSGNGRAWFDFGENLAGFTSLAFHPPPTPTTPPTATATTTANALQAVAQTIILRVVHAETTDARGVPNNVYFPGMEHGLPGGPSATCSMAEWYAHSWYECANQTTAYIFTQPAPPARDGARAPRVSYTPTFTCAPPSLRAAAIDPPRTLLLLHTMSPTCLLE